MKNITRRIEMEEGREVFKVTIRKNHVIDDYAEMVKIQESSNGKRRFYVCLDGFSRKEAEDFLQIVAIDNELRNSLIRSNYSVTYSNTKMIVA